MAKKILLVLVLATVLAAGLSAQGTSFFSVGGGVLIDFGGGTTTAEFANTDFSVDVTNDALGFGGWVFADAKFAELSVGLMGGPFSVAFKIGDADGVDKVGSFFALDISLLGKYPFSLAGGTILLFPQLGVGYQIVTAASFDDYEIETPSDLSVFKIMVGAGADFALGERLYVRASLLGYYRFPNKFEQDFMDTYKDAPGFDTASIGFGGTVKAGIGFKL